MSGGSLEAGQPIGGGDEYVPRCEILPGADGCTYSIVSGGTVSTGSFRAGQQPQPQPPTVVNQVPATLDVVVIEGIRVSSNDTRRQGFNAPNYVRTRAEGDEPWINVRAISSSMEGAEASQVLGGPLGTQLVAQDFGFHIPLASTIAGITVEIDRSVLGQIDEESASLIVCGVGSAGAAGITWATSSALSFNGAPQGDVLAETFIAYDGSMYLSAGARGENLSVPSSGATLETLAPHVSTGLPDGSFRFAAYANGVWMLGRTAGSQRFFSSTDGADTWSGWTNTGNLRPIQFFYTGDKFVLGVRSGVFGPTTFYSRNSLSTDLGAWNALDTPDSDTPSLWQHDGALLGLSPSQAAVIQVPIDGSASSVYAALPVDVDVENARIFTFGADLYLAGYDALFEAYRIHKHSGGSWSQIFSIPTSNLSDIGVTRTDTHIHVFAMLDSTLLDAGTPVAYVSGDGDSFYEVTPTGFDYSGWFQSEWGSPEPRLNPNTLFAVGDYQVLYGSQNLSGEVSRSQMFLTGTALPGGAPTPVNLLLDEGRETDAGTYSCTLTAMTVVSSTAYKLVLALADPASWTPDQINDISFGVTYSAAGSGIAKVDAVRVAVDYSGSFGEELPAKRPRGLAGVAVAPWGRRVAVGNSGKILWSDDGQTWEQADSGTVATLLDVDWAGNRFIAVGRGIILESPDAETWTRVPAPPETLYDVNYNRLNQGVVALGENGIQAIPDPSGIWIARYK